MKIINSFVISQFGNCNDNALVECSQFWNDFIYRIQMKRMELSAMMQHLLIQNILKRGKMTI